MSKPQASRITRLPEIPVYQHFFDGRMTRDIIEWIKRVAECLEECGLTQEDREFLDLLRTLIDPNGDELTLQGFSTIIREDKSQFPTTGSKTTMYVVDNDTGKFIYIWDSDLQPPRYRLIMQDPKTIDVIRGGNAYG